MTRENREQNKRRKQKGKRKRTKKETIRRKEKYDSLLCVCVCTVARSGKCTDEVLKNVSQLHPSVN